MPRAHRAHAEWMPSRLSAWAAQTGPATGRLVAGILERRPHPEQGYRACLGLMRLGRLHGADRLDAACARAERLRSYRFRTVEQILINQQDRLPLEEPVPAPALGWYVKHGSRVVVLRVERHGGDSFALVRCA